MRVCCLVFFTGVVVANFYTGANIDLSDLMVVHLKRQSLHLHWTAERKIRQIPQERLEKELHLIYRYLFVRLICNWNTHVYIAATRNVYSYKHLMWKIEKAECFVHRYNRRITKTEYVEILNLVR